MKGDGEAVGPGNETRYYARATLFVIGVTLFATLTAVGARLVIHIGPVPLTLQVFFVLLSGMVLGRRLGAASQVAYVVAGISGIPVFASPPYAGAGYLMGPTGGYLVGFILAAYLTGLVTEKWPCFRDRGFTVIGYALAGVVGLVAVYSIGWCWLATWIASGGKGLTAAVSGAWKTGVAPFIVADTLKSAAASLTATGALAFTRWL